MVGYSVFKKIRTKIAMGVVLLAVLGGVYTVRLRGVDPKAPLIEQLPINGATEPVVYSRKDDNYGEIIAREALSTQGTLVERVKIFAQEGDNSPNTIERHGILVRHPQAQATVLVCHGFMCDKFDVGFLRQLFPKKQYNIMTFDFRAHGEAIDGQLCTLGYHEAYDVIAAAHFLRNHPALVGKPVFLYGFSMGAAAAIEAQARDRSLFDAMVLDCPFDSTENIIKRGLDNLKISLFGYEFNIPGKTWLQQYAFHPYVQSLVKTVLKAIAQLDSKSIDTLICPVCPADSIKKVTVPCFFIHCRNDEKIPLEAGKLVYENAPCQKSLWITNGRRHFDSLFYNPEVYVDHVTSFYKQVMNGSINKKPRQKIIEDPEDTANATVQAAAKKGPSNGA